MKPSAINQKAKEAHFMEYIVHFTWDEEAGVWIATSDDIPGLVL